MISKQTVFLNADRTNAVKEGDPKARFLLVRQGHEIAESIVEKYSGAAALVGSGKDAPQSEFAESHPLAQAGDGSPTPSNREGDLKLKKRSRGKKTASK